jgi:hypothetical protein
MSMCGVGRESRSAKGDTGADEADIEAQLEAERAEIMRNGRLHGSAAGEQSCSDTLILKVSCKFGSVQIRQGRCDTFQSLRDKFRKHALKQKWATHETNIRLECDDEVVDANKNTPQDFDLEDGMTIEC